MRSLRTSRITPTPKTRAGSPCCGASATVSLVFRAYRGNADRETLRKLQESEAFPQVVDDGRREGGTGRINCFGKGQMLSSTD